MSSHVSIWTLQKLLPEGKRIEYRYAICSLHILSDAEKDVCVHQWEIHCTPRNFVPKGSEYFEDGGEFGVYNGEEKINRGWLTRQSEVLLYFHEARGTDMITVFHPHSDEVEENQPTEQNDVYYSFKVSAKTVQKSYEKQRKKRRPQQSSPVSPGNSSYQSPVKESGRSQSTKKSIPVSVQALNKYEYRRAEQGEFGHMFEDDNDYLVFSTQTYYPESLAFTIEVFEYHTNEATPSSSSFSTSPEYLGVAHLLPRNFKSTSGYAHVSIHGKDQQPVGELTVQYLVVRCLDTDQSNMQVSYAKHWKKRRPLNVGHRGSGISHDSSLAEFPALHLAPVKENTIASFQSAASCGVDMIEFDVLLTKDRIPVVFHDFSVYLNMKKKLASEDSVELFEVPISELTLDQLHLLRVSHSSRANHPQDGPDDEDNPDLQPFPTLRKVFENVPDHLGFNIEIKYPQIYATGIPEQKSEFIERNVFVDTILKVVLEYAGCRRIIFSCFDPDVCTMIQLKQNKFPVLFLNYGETDRYPSFTDQRCQEPSTAMLWALSQGYLGLSSHTEDFLNEKWLLTAVKESGLVLFCWGEDNNKREVMAELKQFGVDAIIYDRVHDPDEPKENIFLVEQRDKRYLMNTIAQLSTEDTFSSLTGTSALPKNLPESSCD
ncbi:glycerophosphocholine phosphodiesterase GPCPD1-like [Saccoglossus kowalevskii]|uniref:Glycerophosphocholine phosphodiesterase GPCPD1-like n=1 Tax=Saccoglossus kowalevskii TaxID=10224 RepID=A0ABM0GT17_SACKO|nr:PREDICTED: glycerophosphocholine phosphodiesterase GPCPD1-like [Saccoglossus kowalevskii]